MRVWNRPAFGLALLGSALLVATVGAGTDTTIRLHLQMEEITAADGSTLPRYEAIGMTPLGNGHYDISLGPGDNNPKLHDVDLTPMSPRVPGLARGNETLTRLALIQREFNRNEVHHAMPDGTDLSIANNCLQRGLWEVKIAKADGGKTTNLYHAWFTFPQDEYARLFAAANQGLPEQKWDALFANYPGVGGFVLPLAELRTVVSEKPVAPLNTHSSDALDRLPEQKGKTKWIRKAKLETYGDVTQAANQPITLAKFNIPGFYDPKESMTFDLAWLSRPKSLVWREVKSSRASQPFPEMELTFENGTRILAADSRLVGLPARTGVPVSENDVLKLVCGIGTPVIHASVEERRKEMLEDRPRYLMILDAKNNHLDNHLTGVDGMYVWREAGTAGGADKIHIWLVSYERIALVGHYSASWPASS